MKDAIDLTKVPTKALIQELHRRDAEKKPTLEKDGFKLGEEVRFHSRGPQLFKIESFDGPLGVTVSWRNGKHKGYCFIHDMIKVEPDAQR